jgi:hypothetical protein
VTVKASLLKLPTYPAENPLDSFAVFYLKMSLVLHNVHRPCLLSFILPFCLNPLSLSTYHSRQHRLCHGQHPWQARENNLVQSERRSKM